MSSATVLMGMNRAEAKRREARAKERKERNQVSPEVRAARSAMLEARQAVLDKAEAEAKTKQEAAPSAFEAILSRGTIDELAEVSRSISRFDGRRLQQMVDDVFRAKARTGYRPDSKDAVAAPASAGELEKAAEESVRRRGRPDGTQAP